MAPEAEEFKIAVYVSDDEEGRRAREALVPGTEVDYVDIVEGWATREQVERLLADGLVVDLVDRRGKPVETSPAPDVRAADLAAVEAQASLASLDPRLDGLDARPEPEAALPEDVYNVRLDGPISAVQREALGALGVAISVFEPPDTYRLFLTREQYAAVRKLDWVRDVSRYGLRQTLAPELAERIASSETGAELASHGNGAGGMFDCVLHRADDLQYVRDRIAEADGIDIVEETDSLVRFRAEGATPFLAALAQLPQVRTLAPYEPAELRAEYARKLIGIDRLNAPEPGRLTGEGELVGVFDSGVDAGHPDLADRLAAPPEAVKGLSPTDTYGHGSHVAGLIAGTGAASGGKVRGAAPGAKLVSVAITDGQSLDVEPDLSRLLALASEKGAKIINLSWGMKLASEYDQGATRFDKFVYENPEILVVVAAGNEGSAPRGYVELRNIGTPATAKNVLTVGACDSDRPDFPELTWGQYEPTRFGEKPACDEPVAGNPDLPAGISSRGPANDYRVKPDLLAPGTCILSVRPEQAGIEYRPAYDGEAAAYGYLSGTSMAAPLVSGAAAVLRQYLRTERDTPNPTAALLKAILVAAARRLPALDSEERKGVGFPDFDQGYGRLDLASVLPHSNAPPGRRLFWDDVRNDSADALESRSLVSDGHRAVRRYRLEVLDSAEPLRVVLTWTDPPAAAVQNNLHLDVGTPAGRVVGNADHRFKLDPAFDAFAGVMFDKRNTVEEVWVNDPQPGTYTVRVVAQNTVFPPQGYALAACGLISDAGLVRG
jgi:serine protease AprX